MHGIHGGINACHASDSVESAVRELAVWDQYFDPAGQDADAAVKAYIESCKFHERDFSKDLQIVSLRLKKCASDFQMTLIREVGVDTEEAQKLLFKMVLEHTGLI
jgi:hypothetical protein